HQRQAEHWTVHIEIRQRLASRYDSRRTGKRVHQIVQRPLHLEDHTPAQRFDPWCVAAKLNGVAKTLLGMKQNSLAGDLPRCGQTRLSEIPGVILDLYGLSPP